MPIVMPSVSAQQLADRILWTADAERRGYATKLAKAYYMLLDPLDVVTFDYNGYNLTGRVTQATIGQNYATDATIVSEDSDNYQSAASGVDNSGFTGQTLTGLAASLLWLFDMPYLSDTDADASGNLGYYFAMNPQGSGSWGAGALYNSTDNLSFSQVGASATALTYGIAQNILGAPRSPFIWDNTNTLTVNLLTGTAPASDTELNVLNGANAAILYPSLEVIQFTTVTLNIDGTYTLSGLLRGRRGTEWAAHSDSHTAGEFVIFPLTGGMIHEQVSLSALNLERFFKGVTVGQDLNSVASKSLTLIGRDLMPYAPAQFKGAKSGSDIVLTWERRTRLGGDPWYNGTNTVPLSEDSESYDVEILSAAGGSVKRTFTGLTVKTVTYTAAQQTADFGSTQSDIAAIVYQHSAQVGRGFPCENDSCVSGAAPVSGGSDATSINGVPIGTPSVDGTIPYYVSASSDIEWALPTLKRQTFTKTTGSLANNATEQSTITMVKAFSVLRITTDKAARVELYNTSAAATADAARTSATDPLVGSGVICDATLGSDLSFTLDLLDAPTGANMESVPVNTITYRVTNLSGSTGTVTLNITVIPFEQ